MSNERNPWKPQIDEWVWGRETILWGAASTDQYTLKMLEPKVGRAGCLSLQYHDQKSESWVVWSGVVWALAIVDQQVSTRVMSRGDIQNLPTGTVHRLMSITSDAAVLEPSTPDRHAADKSAPKDVKRLHCVHGRPSDPPRSQSEAALVLEAIRVTEDAIQRVEGGNPPLELRPELMLKLGGWRIPRQ